jgi:hypothetical protein
LVLIFTTTFAAEYTIPRAAYSVYSEDLDLDGDKDIVVGHKTAWGHYNPTISILKNERKKYLNFLTISNDFLKK